MRHGLHLPNFGDFADPRVVADVARVADESGWDGVFVWDHVRPQLAPGDAPPTADVTVLLTAIALATSRVRFGALVTPLSRRRPAKVARETATLDRLSGGRLVVGVGLGNPPDAELADLGEEVDPVVRGAMLDEALDVLAGLWSGEPVRHRGRHFTVEDVRFAPTPLQRPRPPVWVAATWPGHPRPLRRAARWDGVVPISSDTEGQALLTPEEVAAVRAAVGRYDVGFAVVASGVAGADPAPYAEAGATWWLELPFSAEQALERARRRPARVP